MEPGPAERKSTTATCLVAISGSQLLLLANWLFGFRILTNCELGYSDSHSNKPAAVEAVTAHDIATTGSVAKEPTTSDVEEGAMEAGEEEEEEEEEEAMWNAAHKKYQEFQEACEDILDPSRFLEGMECLCDGYFV